MEEYFDILDDDGNKTGKSKSRTDVHKNGYWHKTVHIWIVNDKNDILLQKRSPHKQSNPDKWDISAAGHIAAGEDSITGSLREINEELGFDVRPHDLRLLGTLKRPDACEFSDVYLLRLSIDPTNVTLDPEEVSEIKYISLSRFKEMIAARDKSLLMHLQEFDMLFKAIGE